MLSDHFVPVLLILLNRWFALYSPVVKGHYKRLTESILNLTLTPVCYEYGKEFANNLLKKIEVKSREICHFKSKVS